MKKLHLASFGFVLNLVLVLALPAQSDISSPPPTVDWNSASDLEVLLQAVEMTPTIPATAAPREGTFWSAQHAPGTRLPWPPLPANIRQSSLWNLGDDVFLLSDLKINYSVPPGAKQPAGGMMAADGMSPPGSGTNIDVPLFNFIPDYGTNLYIAQLNQGPGGASGIVSNSTADILYEIQSVTNLAQTNWVSEGFIYGSELTNWTPLSVAQNGRPNLFLRIRSWQDSTGTGIPDWWWLTYFGQTTNVNAYGYTAGDAYNNLQKFQMGLVPATFYTPPAPAGFSAVISTNNVDVLLSWDASSGPVQTYNLAEYTYNPNTSTWNSQQVAQVSSPATAYNDAGVGNSVNLSQTYFDLAANYLNGPSSHATAWPNYASSSSSTPVNHISVAALLARNGTGRWELMFPGRLPASVLTVRLSWATNSPDSYGGYFCNIYSSEDIPANGITNGVYPISDGDIVNRLGDAVLVQGIATNSISGMVSFAGIVSDDAPYFVDGRRQMKQNLNFLLQGASLDGTFGSAVGAVFLINGSFLNDPNAPRYDQSATNFEEFGFIDWQMSADNLWPFDANYDLENFALDTSRTNSSPTGFDTLDYIPDFGNPYPSSPLLNGNPQWIIQPGFGSSSAGDWGVTLQNTNTEASLSSGLYNLYGLPYQSGCAIGWSGGNFGDIYEFFNAGANTTMPSGNTVGFAEASLGYASQTPAASLQLVNYYFAPILNPNDDPMGLGNGGIYAPEDGRWTLIGSAAYQPYSFPLQVGFNVTNQTPLMIVAVGQSVIIGAWAKYSISNRRTTQYS